MTEDKQLTVYMLIAIIYEERSLVEFLGEPYIQWRKRTPMFIPRLGGSTKADDQDNTITT